MLKGLLMLTTGCSGEQFGIDSHIDLMVKILYVPVKIVGLIPF